MKQASAFTVIFLIFICSAVYSFSTYVQPGIPNEKDDIFIIVDGGLSGGATIIDSGVTVSENSITVSIAIEPCTDSICPALYEIVSLSFPIGKLSARTYMLNTFIYYIYDTTTSSPPDTSGENYSGSFEVFADSEPVPRLVGLYVTNHEEKDEYYTGCYYFTNGDTLSVVAVFEVHCCAQFTSDLSFSGDTLIVTLEDTSEAPCSCVGQHYVTSAIANIENDKQPVKVIFKSEWYNPEFSPFIADISKPAVCINIQDSTEAGFKLFIDSRWFEYEINSPFISSANVLRLQPNTDFVAYDSNYIYLDDIMLISTESGGDIKTNILEDFENYDESEWKLVGSWDGSSLEMTVVSTDSSDVLKLIYSNSLSGSCTNYIWKLLKSDIENQTQSRILIHASLISPDESTPLERGSGYSRKTAYGINVIPNPFILNSKIKIKMPEKFDGDRINLSIVNLHGQEVCSVDLFRENSNNNVFNAVWDGLDNRRQSVSSGSYILKVDCKDMILQRKIILKK